MSVKIASQNDNVIIETEEEDTDGLSKEDENRFNILCANVISCMVLLQNSHSELLDFKSVLLKENIAPSVLVKLSLINGKIFRSLSDLHNPLGELVRLVGVYSEPWEKKSEALRKLHKDYEKKAGQLNVALKSLSRQYEEAKRVTRKETLQNWELLFTRAQLARNHGRRWKYRMFEFKLKVSQGIENLQDYFQQLLDEDDGIKEKVKHVQREPPKFDIINKNDMDDAFKDFEEINTQNLENDQIVEDEEYHESVEEKDETDSVEPIETVDACVGTSDLNFSQTLIMRIYNPKGLQMYENLKCRIIYGDKLYETSFLDKSQQEEEEERKIEKEINEALQASVSVSPKGKGGLIGRRKNKLGKIPEKSMEQIKKEQLEKKLRSLARYEEIKIPIPSDVIAGISKDVIYQSIKIILFNHGKEENKIVQATIDLEELKGLDLKIFKEYVYQGDMVTPPPTAGTDEKPFPNLEPLTFPLYEYQEQQNLENPPVQMGQLPISCFYSRKEDQIFFHRSTETESINRLVEELTGINLDIITKEELTREKIDESLSPRPLTPPPSTVLKSEYDSILIQHTEEMKSLREYYENKMSELVALRQKSPDKDKEQFTSTSVFHKDCAVSPIFPYRSVPGKREKYNESSKPHSSKSKDTLSTSGPDDQDDVLFTNYDQETYKVDKKNISNLKLDLPDNFLERMSFYSEISNKNKEELASKVKSEISKAIEEKLAELYRIHDDLTEEDISVALADMCLPAMFMPFTNSTGTIYNPRAHQYFHPIGLKNLRLSQAPSIFKLPPIKNNQLSVLNLFEIGNQMQIKRLENDSVNENVLRKIMKSSSNHLVQPETTRIFSGDN